MNKYILKNDKIASWNKFTRRDLWLERSLARMMAKELQFCVGQTSDKSSTSAD